MERIRTTFTGKEKSTIIGAVLAELAKGTSFTTEDVKKKFFEVQDRVVNIHRQIDTNKWPVVEKWLVPNVASFIKLKDADKKLNETQVEGLQRQLRESKSREQELLLRVADLEAQVVQLNKQLSAPKNIPANKKPSVVVVGLLHSQEQIIRERHHEAFKLSFVTSDQYHGNQCEAKLLNADKVFLMIDFINHNDMQARLKGKAVLVRGGMNTLHRVMCDTVI